LKPDGSLLFALRPRTIAWDLCEKAYPALLGCARPTTKRRVAAGGQDPFHSGTIGHLNGKLTYATPRPPFFYGNMQFHNGKIYSTSNHSVFDDYRNIWLLLRSMAHVFDHACPDQYRVLKEAAARTPREWLWPLTAFTSATVNRNARMAVHKDDGNLPGAYGAMTVMYAGDSTGGLLVFPKYRVAVDLYNTDCLIADNQEAHGNTAMEGEEGFERVSVIAYFHSSNLLE
jgi:hypothetical protein